MAIYPPPTVKKIDYQHITTADKKTNRKKLSFCPQCETTICPKG